MDGDAPFLPGDRLTNRQYRRDVRYVTRVEGGYVFTTDIPGGQREHVMPAWFYAEQFERERGAANV